MLSLARKWVLGLALLWAAPALADVSSWSTTPASNATITDATCGSINWAEGQAPSTVNDSARATMANIRCWLEDGGWFKWGDTHTYASATTTTVSGDVTARYAVGRRARAVGSLTGTIYGRISASSYSAPNTTITYQWDSGSLNSETLTIAVGLLNSTGHPQPADQKGAVNFAKGTSIASATTTSIGNATGNVIHVTGTTSIADFGTAPQAGTTRLVIFDGALNLQHNTSLINLPGSTSITTAAGDWALAVADTTTQWYVPFYQKVSGAPVAGAVTSVATADLATGGPITSTGTVTVTAATQADMETATSTTTAVVPGRTKNHPGVAKAWGLITSGSGSCSFAASYGMTSCTRASQGNFSVTFSTAFSSANYVCHVMASNQNDTANFLGMAPNAAPSTTGFAFRVNDGSGVATDFSWIAITCFGDQ